jgi:(R,R)-butanediol dehydrogenase / meso-butanediol dehydrogenase / diacetyl reductase
LKASYYRRNGRFETGTAPIPVPGPGEALIRVRRVGICGTDLHIFQGHLDHRVPEGGIIGHETFGEVVTAPADSGFAAGDRVVVEPVQFCGQCRACRMGATYLCYHLKVLGVDVTGGMQEYWAVPAARLLKLPDSVSDHDAPLIEPLAVATHDVGRAGIKAGDRVVVFGGGPIGTLIALVCRQRGAEVKVSEINPHRVTMLQQFGLDAIGPGADVKGIVNDWTDGTGADFSFEVSGSPDAAALVTEVVRVWGTVSIIAIHSHPVPFNLYSLFARELNVMASRLYTRSAWEQAIDLVARGEVNVGPLVSRTVPLEGLQQGMEEALGGGPVMKVLVDVGG